MRLSKHPHNYADPPEIISTGDGWRVRISGCDTFDQVNEMGCKQYRAFDVAQGLATREEAEAVLRQYLSLAAARLPPSAPFGYVFDDMSRLGSGDRAHVHGEAVEGRTKPLYAEPPLCPSAPTGPAPTEEKTFTVFVRASNNTGTTYITTVEAADTEEAKRIGLAECQDEWGYPEDHLTVVGVAEGDVNILEWDDIK